METQEHQTGDNTENTQTAINGCLHSRQFEDVDTLNIKCYIYFSRFMSRIFLQETYF